MHLFILCVYIIIMHKRFQKCILKKSNMLGFMHTENN